MRFRNNKENYQFSPASHEQVGVLLDSIPQGQDRSLHQQGQENSICVGDEGKPV